MVKQLVRQSGTACKEAIKLVKQQHMAKFYFYYSAMNAGKSTTLLQAEFNYRERGMNPLLLSPMVDNRYGSGKITSRIGLHASA